MRTSPCEVSLPGALHPAPAASPARGGGPGSGAAEGAAQLQRGLGPHSPPPPAPACAEGLRARGRRWSPPSAAAQKEGRPCLASAPLQIRKGSGRPSPWHLLPAGRRPAGAQSHFPR